MLATEQEKILIYEAISEKAKEKFFKKQVIIFGCTTYARDIRDALRANGIEISAVVDNSTNKVGTSCLGVCVYAPEEYLSPFDENKTVVVCSKYYFEMIRQIELIGYREGSNILNIDLSVISWEVNDSLAATQKAYLDVKKGYDKYIEIIEKYNRNYKLFLCPYPGTGDIYLACSFFDEYLKKQKIEKYIFAVIRNNCAKVAELFDVENIEIISETEMQLLLKAWQFLGDNLVNLKPLLHWGVGWRCKKELYPDKFPQISFADMLRYDVYGLNEFTAMKRPQNQGNMDYVVALFKQLGLKEGKTVILAPYAGSFVSEMSTEQWDVLAEMLIEKGYTVCTNCYGNEKPVKNTVPIQFSYKEAVNVLEYAGTFVALRSGLCDVVSPAKCKMIIIYEEGFNAGSYSFFSLKKMGLRNDVFEVIFKKTKDFIIEILEKVICTDN